MEVGYTKHALDKLKILRNHGVLVSKDFVSRTVRNPELEDNISRAPLRIAVGKVDESHYLRIVITFYPVRKGRYEGKI